LAHVESVQNARDSTIIPVGTKRNNNLFHPTLNFSLAHNYGGFGDPTDLDHVNIFTDEVDLPLIKPYTVQQN
jgi:hypothetical protein